MFYIHMMISRDCGSISLNKGRIVSKEIYTKLYVLKRYSTIVFNFLGKFLGI